LELLASAAPSQSIAIRRPLLCLSAGASVLSAHWATSVGGTSQHCAVSADSALSQYRTSLRSPTVAFAPLGQPLQESRKRPPPGGFLSPFSPAVLLLCAYHARASDSNPPLIILPSQSASQSTSCVCDHGQWAGTACYRYGVLINSKQAVTPITPLEPGVEMFQKGKAQPFYARVASARTSLERPASIASDTYTDIEDDSSEFEEYSLGSSVSATFRQGQLGAKAYRTRIAEARRLSRLLRKFRHRGTSSLGHSSPMNGIFPKLLKGRGGPTFSVHRNRPTIFPSTLPYSSRRCFRRKFLCGCRHRSAKQHLRLSSRERSTTPLPLPWPTSTMPKCEHGAPMR
jgi:hypothetical protein